MAKSWLSTEITILFSLAVFLIFSPAPVCADEYQSWTGEFMRMGAGARAMGMGNAYTAVDGDIYSSYFNPAGLVSMKSRQMTFSFRQLSMDRRFKYFAIGSRIGPDADFAISWLNVGTEDITGRDLNGNPTESLQDNRNSFTLTFSKYLTQWLSLGLNTKLSYWKLADDDAKSFGFDLGVLANPLRNLTASFVLRDINSRFKWKSDRWKKTFSSSDSNGQTIEKEDKFPIYYTGGLAYRLFNKILLSSTVEYIEDNPLGLNAGVSYEFTERFTLRTGVYNYSSLDELNSESFTAGFTLRVSSSLNLDYAFATDNADNDNIHIIAIVLGYGD
ncbi:MAG: PorV/PorQ family protein [Candidatus Latescibacteria bacterium]|nr:PorV/PorQ family protein [Candidatus Latescibacterota bacterium]